MLGSNADEARRQDAFKEISVPNVQAVLKQEMQRVARKEVRSELEATRKAVSAYRRDIAELKRRNADLERRVSFLESRETARLKAGPAKAKPPKGTRFSVRSLKSQRTRAGLSQGDYAKLVGVSASTLYNWESGTTKPGPKHMATLVSLRGLGKREAQRRLALL